MEPRLKTSTKWTPFPTELLEQIQAVVENFFEDYEIENGQFVVDGAIYPTEILLQIGITRPGQLRQDNFIASLEYDSKNEKPMELINLMSDFLGEVWVHFLEDEPEYEDLPRQWQANTFEKKPIYLRYTSENTSLEKQADALLGIDKSLVYGDDELDDESMESMVDDVLGKAIENRDTDDDSKEGRSLH